MIHQPTAAISAISLYGSTNDRSGVLFCFYVLLQMNS